MEEDRIKKLEKISERLLRRAVKTKAAMITPFPISNVIFNERIEGIVLNYMFPCEGIITKGIVDIGKKIKKGVIITVSVNNKEFGSSKSFTLITKSDSIEPMLKINTGDKLTVSLSYDDDENITESWVAFLWIPTIKDTIIKHFLIADLEAQDEGI